MEDENKDLDPEIEASEALPSEGYESDPEELSQKLREENERLKASNARLFERAKKAEGFVKIDGEWTRKPKPEHEPEVTTNRPSVDPDELKLIARGLSDEEIEQAKVIAKGKAIPLQEAIKDPLFSAFQKEAKDQERRERAKLGASKGSGQTEDNQVKSGMTSEEHRAAWEKARA